MLHPVSPVSEFVVSPVVVARRFLDSLVKRPVRLLVAVSGGSDSTGLLLAFHDCLRQAQSPDVELHAITIDHGLRAESADEARAVSALCRRLHVPHTIRRWDGIKPSTGLAAAARSARYALIAAAVEDIGADAVLLGHTEDDQRETVAMRTGRSTRPDNLGRAGMADAVLYRSRHWFMRPFLRVSRADIRHYLVEKGQSWFDDPSNDDMAYERVRARNRADAGGQGPAMGDDRSSISRRAAMWIDHHATCYGAFVVKLDPAGLANGGVEMRLAMSALACVLGGKPFGMPSTALDRVMAFVCEGRPGRMTSGRVVFDWRRDGLYLYREDRDLPVLTVPPHASAIWDGRYSVTNDSTQAIAIRGGAIAGDRPALPGGLSPAVVKRALASVPVIDDPSGTAFSALVTQVILRPTLAPYDLFLPRFDLALANSIAALTGRAAYPQPPDAA